MARRSRFPTRQGLLLRVTGGCGNYEFSIAVDRTGYSTRSTRAGRLFLLLGGDKTGNSRWYDENVPLADDRYDDYLREIEKEG